MDDRNVFQLQLVDELRLVCKRYRRELDLTAVAVWEAVSDLADEIAASGPDVLLVATAPRRADTANDDNG